MKRSIQWHEQCLKSMKLLMEKDIQSVNLANENLASFGRSISTLESQIQRAKELKKDSFDDEKFMIPKTSIK